MSKYQPLYNYLRRRPGPEVEMSFADIERVIGCLLPKRAWEPWWWANERSDDDQPIQQASWLNAGYEAVRLGDERVLFRRSPARA